MKRPSCAEEPPDLQLVIPGVFNRKRDVVFVLDEGDDPGLSVTQPLSLVPIIDLYTRFFLGSFR
jgi:hypothetical protein